MHNTYLIYKPFGMLSQFSRETPQQQTLADLGHHFEKNIYPVGRLDADSEGLLLLSNDTSLTDKLLNPKYAHARTYWVQVEKVPTEIALQQLQSGLEIKINGQIHKTLPCKARLLEASETHFLPERNPPIRHRANIPTAWLEIQLTEGKNRQVRRMTAAIGFPTLRLVRVAIGGLKLAPLSLAAGDCLLLNSTHLSLLYHN
jgi:23S rRNA pseudouridine2457 synthase